MIHLPITRKTPYAHKKIVQSRFQSSVSAHALKREDFFAGLFPWEQGVKGRLRSARRSCAPSGCGSAAQANQTGFADFRGIMGNSIFWLKSKRFPAGTTPCAIVTLAAPCARTILMPSERHKWDQNSGSVHDRETNTT
jgi:hypothetical protein